MRCTKMLPERAVRDVPYEEKSLVGFLAKELSGYWQGSRPSGAQLANHAVKAGTFLTLNARAPLLEDALRGSRLSDLGAGLSVGMEAFSLFYGVREYVAVDLYERYPSSGTDGRVRYVNSDLLLYLAAQPDSSTNVCMNAMDILNHGDRVVLESYLAMVLRQISRAVPPGGIAFGMQTPMLHGLADFGFERIEDLGDRRVGILGAVYRKAWDAP
ncbi:MAG TPA: hypothetical protein VLD37_03845 [Candidatus Bilamarchaeum sp.]|nr:hypothetical protein [Candidatus Bilamarchaeum sp.]